MSKPAISPENIHAYLEQHQNKELCRFVTVGSVDDGKSTLIGRLLHDTHGIYEDQLAAAKKASKQEGGEVDFSLFTDGLKAEREQGITIDVAYRYFSTEKRKFIIADTPGHVQYTRNMATGASTANVAIILIDARLGVLQQSRRHAYIASMLSIPHLCVCVNKMDLEDYEQGVFDDICKVFSDFTKGLKFREVKFIPISAKLGDNVVHTSDKTPWYEGGTILDYLESVPVHAGLNHDNFRLPVQYVIRPNLDYRGFAGTVASGTVNKGDRVVALPSGNTSKVASIDTFDGELEHAFPPQAITIRLEDEIDISRGDLLAHEHDQPQQASRFQAKLVWMSERALDRAVTYLLKQTTQTVRADIESVNYLIDLETLDETPANRIELNDIGHVTISAHRPLFVDPYADNPVTGAFILIDPISNNTVAAGMLEQTLDPSAGQQRADLEAAMEVLHTRVTAEERSQRLDQKGALIWLTGLPAAGKTELAFELERRLFDQGKVPVVVDPSDGMSRNVTADGSSPPQAPELARRFTGAGLLAIFAYGTPLHADRSTLRDAVGNERFVEVHVSTPIEECKERDQRGAYDAVHREPHYEQPQDPAVEVDLSKLSASDAADRVIQVLNQRGFLKAN